MVLKNVVHLKKGQIQEIDEILSKGKHTAQKSKRARALLLAHQGYSDREISEITLLTAKAVEKIRRRFVDNGFEVTLHGQQRSGRPPILTTKDEANLIALACEQAPDGEARQTVRGLTEKFVTEDGKHVSRETVHRVLKRNNIKPWQHKEWCIPPEQKQAFVEAMEGVLTCYESKSDPDPMYPLICMDESPIQLLGEVREPIPLMPGSPRKVDSEYKRCGTACLFVFVGPYIGWRRIDVTDRRTRLDFAGQIRKLVFDDFPDAKKITIVLDNLNTHNEKSIYEAFTRTEADEILRRIELLHTPVHGSWLNMAEIEIGRAKRKGLKKRICNKKELIKQVKAFVKQSNEAGITINWGFGVKEARIKMKRVYPDT